MTAAVVLLNPRAAGGRAAALRDPIERWLRTHAPDVVAARRRAASTRRRRICDRCRSLRGSWWSAATARCITCSRRRSNAATRSAWFRSAAGTTPRARSDCSRCRGERALAHAMSAPSLAIDIGELTTDGRRVPFVSSLCAGFDASICARVVVAPRFLRGLPRYLWGTLGELAGLRRWAFASRWTAKSSTAASVLFASTCNTPTFGSGMPAVPQCAHRRRPARPAARRRVRPGRRPAHAAAAAGRHPPARQPGVDPVLSIAADHQRRRRFRWPPTASRCRRFCTFRIDVRPTVARLRRRSTRRGVRPRRDRHVDRR